MCLIVGGDHGVFLKEGAVVPRTLALELLDEMLVHNAPLFQYPAFAASVRLKVSERRVL
jgi:hypothetical protein